MRQLTVDQMPVTEGEQAPKAQLYTIGGVLGIWLVFVCCQWLLWKINQLISPETLAHYSSFWFALAGIVTLVLVYYQRPKIFTLSRFRPEWIDLPIVALCVYVDINLRYLAVQPPFERGFSGPLDMTFTIAILPVIEELIAVA